MIFQHDNIMKTAHEIIDQEIKTAVRGDEIDAMLAERGSRYGDFHTHALITQELKSVLHRCVNWPDLRPDMKEALEMVMHKIGRIMNGDPYYKDSWQDIIGYTKLVADTLEDNNELTGQDNQTLSEMSIHSRRQVG